MLAKYQVTLEAGAGWQSGGISTLRPRRNIAVIGLGTRVSGFPCAARVQVVFYSVLLESRWRGDTVV